MINGPEIGSDILWIDVVGHVFRVLEFDRAGTTIGAGDTVKAKSRFKPYGYLLVESPIFNQPAKLPIVHRDDFILAATVFDEPHLADLVTEEELLVTYVPKQHLPTGHALGTSHALHYVIVPRGTLDHYYDTDAHLIAPLNQVFGELVYEGEIKVQVNPEPFLGQHRPEGIHTTKLAWQETVKKEIELNKALLSTFHVRFSEGYGLSGAQVSKYADVLAAATIENSHSRRESELPSTPEQIRLAILEVTKLAVAKHDDDVTFELLKMAYSSLARFLPEPEAQLVAARNIAWLSEDPNHPPFERSADAEQIDASVEADESQLADEFDQLVAKVKEKQKIQEELEWLRNEKAKVIRQKAKLELELSKAFRDLNPDDPDAIMEDLLEEFRSSDVREGSAGKYCGDALMAWRKGDRETAFDLFTNAIELDSDDPVTLLNRGNLQLEMGRFEAGIEDLERAREMAPELPCVNADIMKMLDAEEREDWRQQMLKKHRPE